jgi:AGCS family alanine or glycine:cation symporter
VAYHRPADDFETIFRCAFGWQEAAAGAVGYTISQALTSGFQRGMFSNEAGMGSTPNSAASCRLLAPSPGGAGIVQMIGVFIDTIVICTASAVIITAGARGASEEAANGIQAIQHAMSNWSAAGEPDLSLSSCCCSPSVRSSQTISMPKIISFFSADSLRNIWLLRLLTLCMVVTGAMVSLPVVWQMADIIMALMAITNLTAILLLSPTVRIIASDYLRQRKLGQRRNLTSPATRNSSSSWPRDVG